MKWNDERLLEGAKDILRTSRSMPEALSRLSAWTGEEVTGDAWRNAWGRQGLGPPSAMLSGGRYSGARVAELAEDDAPTTPGYAPRDTDPAPPASQEGRGWTHASKECIAETPDRAFIDAPPPTAWPMPATGSSRWLFIPDCHIPYHDSVAYQCMVNAARVLKPDGIVIIGDYADCYTVSFHEKDPARGSRLKDELDAVNEKLDELDGLGARHKVYVRGNHESRVDRYIADKAKALYGLVELGQILRLRERGWIDVPYLATYSIGDAVFTHTITKYGGQNAHRQTRDAFNATSVVGHTHRLSWEPRGDFFGGFRIGMTIGCLLSFELLDYEHKAKACRDWAHGFGEGTLDHETGRFHVRPIPIVQGRCVVDGQVVRA